MNEMTIPTKQECLKLLNKNKTPFKIIKHTKTVCKIAEDIADKLIRKGVKLNKRLVVAAALLHDIEKAKPRHVVKGTMLLKKLGYPEVADVIKKHSLYKLGQKNRRPNTFEEKIVFYADKRAKGNKIVSLEKRFKALEKHYKVNLSKELIFTKKIEKGLLGNEKL
ncbi:HD domain-containing protein [Candidatus Woesearchaeota archaeon]|nr:HD domain-containing protein [Candidatus Woesearchaeota archaeon]